MGSDDAGSILSRGGNLRLSPPVSRRLGMLAPLTIALISIRLVDGGRTLTMALLGIMLASGIAALVVYSRAFVSVVGPVMRWRTGVRVEEVSLALVGMPQRVGGLGGNRLFIPLEGRRAVTLHGRLWGGYALDSLEQRLAYNARIARPRALDAST